MTIPPEYRPVVAGVIFAAASMIASWISDWLWKRKMDRECKKEEEKRHWQTPL